MKHGDKQLGFPETPYTNTKSVIEALSGVVEGSVAYATDTNEVGYYNGAAWEWIELIHNATQIQGVDVDAATPTEGDGLYYDAGSGDWEIGSTIIHDPAWIASAGALVASMGGTKEGATTPAPDEFGDMLTYWPTEPSNLTWRAMTGVEGIFLTNVDHEIITGYKSLIAVQPPEDSVFVSQASSGSSEVLLEEFATQDLDILKWPAGVWKFVCYAKTDVYSPTAYIRVRVYRRAPGGAETQLFTFDQAVNTTDITRLVATPVPAEQSHYIGFSLVVKYYAYETGGTPRTISLYFDASHPSHFVPTVWLSPYVLDKLTYTRDVITSSPADDDFLVRDETGEKWINKTAAALALLQDAISTEWNLSTIARLKATMVGSPEYQRDVELLVSSLANYTSIVKLRAETPSDKQASILAYLKRGAVEKKFELAHNGTDIDAELEGTLKVIDLLIGADVNLYRSAADILKTDDQLQVVGDIRTTGGIRVGSFGSIGDAKIYAEAQIRTDDRYLAKELSAAPSATSGYGQFYALNDSLPYYMRDDGIAIPLITKHLPLDVLTAKVHTGSPTMTDYTGTGRWGWALPPGSTNGFKFTHALPIGWAGRIIWIDIWWCPETADSSTVSFTYTLSSLSDGEVPTDYQDGATGGNKNTPGTALEIVKSTYGITDTFLTEGEAFEVGIWRGHDDAFDDDVYLCAAQLRIEVT